MTWELLERVRRLTVPVRHPVNTGVAAYWRLRALPSQSVREIRLLKKVLASVGHGRLRVFEWGMGRSTVYYPCYLRAIDREFEWHAIDSSADWYKRVQRRVAAAGLEHQVRLYCEEFPPASALPGSTVRHAASLSAYPDIKKVMRYVEYPRILGMAFDVMVVDGRFRRRCLLEARQTVDPHGVVLLHDAQRPYYHGAFRAYPRSVIVRGWRFPGSIPRSQMWIGSVARDVGMLANGD